MNHAIGRDGRVTPIAIPPNPALGGVVLAFAESRLMSGRSVRMKLVVEDPFDAKWVRLADVISVLEGCVGVEVVGQDVIATTQASGRFETPISLVRIASPAEIRSVVRFQSQVRESAWRKLPSHLNRGFLVTHGNVAEEAYIEHSKLTAQQFIGLLDVLSSLPGELPILAVGEDSNLIEGMQIPEGVILAENLGLTQAEQFHLVQEASLFVGMSSGPSVFALASNVPYLVLKHKSHHARLMDVMLKRTDRIPFALPNQRFLLIDNFVESTLASLNAIVHDLPFRAEVAVLGEG